MEIAGLITAADRKFTQESDSKLHSHERTIEKLEIGSESVGYKIYLEETSLNEEGLYWLILLEDQTRLEELYPKEKYKWTEPEPAMVLSMVKVYEGERIRKEYALKPASEDIVNEAVRQLSNRHSGTF